MVLREVQFLSAAAGTRNMLGDAGSTLLLAPTPAEDRPELTANRTKTRSAPVRTGGSSAHGEAGAGWAPLLCVALGRSLLL